MQKSSLRWMFLVVILVGGTLHLRLHANYLGNNDDPPHEADDLPTPSNNRHTSGKRSSATLEAVSPRPNGQHETWIPNSFGACLKIRDDNIILPEWLAYHYAMFPLRYLVISNDPKSVQSPLDILQRWNATDLRYWLVDDHEFLSAKIQKDVDRYTKRGDDRRRLYWRQHSFMLYCNRFLQKQNATWVMHIDTDEFLVPNRKRFKHGPEDETAIFNSIHTLYNSSTCIPMARWTHGSNETLSCPTTTTATTTTTAHIDTSMLETFRYVQTTRPDDPSNSWGKAIIDVSRIPYKDLKPKSAHRPSYRHCPPADLPFAGSPLVVHHYLGSWGRYNIRPDKRRSRDIWESRGAMASVQNSCVNQMQLWLDVFVQKMGLKRAKYLLGS